jgi:serine/threonine-protein kinase
MPTVDEFWNLLGRSRLVDAGAVESLRTAHAAAGPAGDAKATAQWLVGRGAITRWQAKRLAIGDLGPFFLGDYRLLERHDRRGDGLLFTARHDPSGRVVALMLLNARRCKQLDVWTAIVRRTTAAHHATDPMLSRTWALEQAEGGRFIVCESVTGEPLADELARLGPLPAPQAAVLALQISRAVAEIHAAGAVHGGLSLDALLREPAAAGMPQLNARVRLLQFPLVGDPHVVPLRVAVATGADLAALGRRVSFIAPELLLPDRSCDAGSDVFAIGCILHALLTGVPPCWAGDPQAALRQLAFAGPPPLEPPVPPGIAALVQSLTARDPEARPSSAGEAAAAIAACCGIAASPSAIPDAVPPTGHSVEALVRGSRADAAVDADALDAGFTWQPAESESAAVRAAAGGMASPPAVSAATLAARRRAARLRLVGGGVAALVFVAAAALVVSQLDLGGPRGRSLPPVSRVERPAEPTEGERVPPPPGAAAESAADQAPTAAVAPGGDSALPASPPPVAVERQIVVDDPNLPWASPTSGLAPRLEFLPPGSQLVLLARPAATLAAEEGRLFYRSLGPAAESAAGTVAAWCGCELADIERLQIGWQSGAAGDVREGVMLRLVESRRLPQDEAARVAAWGQTTPVEVEGQTIHRAARRCYWLPPAGQDRTLVVAEEDALREIIAAAAAAPAEGPAVSLPKETETLVGMLDADRHLTLFGSPHYLVHDGRRLLAGPLAQLADPLATFFGDAIRAAAVSLHFGDHAYAELDAVATADAPVAALAPALATAVADLADRVEASCVALEPAAYGRRLVLRLPQMIRALAANLRVAAEGKGVVVNAYLPRPAAHNLALATELVLAQTSGRAGTAAVAAAAAPQDALGKLRKKITLTFAKDTLERSIQLIAEEIGVPMEILGPDLQLEGITKNQSFGLDETDKTAEAVLRTILAKANPDGKLVFVVRKQDGQETIEITTRAAAQKRGDTLPAGQ